MNKMNEDKVDNILKKLQKIEERLDHMDAKCESMQNHARFVEKVYETLRTPLDVVSSYIFRYTPFLSEDHQQLLPPPPSSNTLKDMER